MDNKELPIIDEATGKVVDESEGVAAYRERVTPTPQKVDESYAIDFDVEDVEIDFIGDTELQIARTPTSNKELSLLTSTALQKDASLIEQELEVGDEQSLNETYAQIQAELEQFTNNTAAQGIAEAESPEEVVNILQKLKEEGKPTVTLSTLRTYALSKMPEIKAERLGYVSQRVARNMILAQEIQKRSNEVQANTSLMGVIGDVGEYFLPTATASEQILKYKDNIPEALEQISKAPPEKQVEVLNAFLDGWEQQETLLINNNNSLMTTAQFESLRNAILQGGLDLIEGKTSAEIEQYMETALDVGIGAIGAKGAFQSVKALFGFLTKRTMSSDSVELDTDLLAKLFDPNTSSKNTINENQAFWKTEPEYIDRRVALQEAAKNKNTRKFRKTLESEKVALGAREYALLNTGTLNTEARALSKEKKIKFKEALKQVREVHNKNLSEVQGRQEIVQAHINDFDNAASAESELSRLNQLIKDGRLNEGDLLEPTGTIKVELGTRGGSHITDTQFIEVPTDKLKLEVQGGLSKVQETTGMTKEQIATRQVFTPTEDTDIGLPNIMDELTEMTELLLVDKDEVSLGMARARDLETQAGTSLKVINSATGFKANAVDNSLGTFTFLLGDGTKGGYKSADEASNAAKVGLAGVDHKIVEKDGMWYAEATVEHRFDPTKDVTGLYLDPDAYTGAAGRATLNPLRILGSDVMRGLFALKGKNRSIVQKMEERFKKSVRGLGGTQGASLAKVLEKGDMESKDWTSFSVFKNETGVNDKEVFTAYRAMRDIYDDIYEMRNKVYHQKLSSQNMKFVDDGADGNLGKVLNPKKDIDSEDGLVWDMETKQLITPQIDDGYNYVRLSNAVDAGEEIGKRAIVRVKPEKISKLPEKILNARKGHIDRFYRETGWIVRKTSDDIVDGKKVSRSSTTHIVASEKAAKRIAEEVGGEAEGVVAIRSRENDDMDAIFGSDNDVQFSYGSSHTKKRGEQLKGSDGMNAPTLNAFETIGKSITSTQSSLDFNLLKSVESRFYNEFGDILSTGKGTKFSSNADSMLKDKSKISTKQANDFYNWHSYIKTLRTHANGSAYKAIDGALSPVLDPILGIVGKGTDAQEAVMSLKRLVSNLFVVLNPFYQVPQNLTIGIYIASAKGSNGVKAALQLPALIQAKTTGNYKMLAKLVGGDESLARELVKELDNNGLVDAIGRSNDFLDMARGNLDVGATSALKSTRQGFKRHTYGRAYNAAKGSQEISIAAMNMLSYLAEFNKVVRKGGKFNAKAKMEISFQAQKNVQTQNSLDMFKYQDNSSMLGLPLQFFQHVNKLFLDIILEPQYKVITGAVESIVKREINSGRNLGKEAGPYAKTYAQAIVTTALTYSVFGMSGGLGQGIGSKVEDILRKQFPEMNDTPIFETLMNGVLNETFNGTVEHLGGKGAVDITSTYGPAAFIDMVHGFLLQDFPSFNVMGVSGAAVGSIFESATSIKAITIAPNIDSFDKATMIASEIAEPISGLRNIEKAVIGYLFQSYPYTKTLAGGPRIEAVEAIMLAANIQPELVQDYFNKSNFSSKGEGLWGVFGDERTAKRNAQTMIQAMTRDMAYQKMKGTLTLEMSNDLLEKWSVAAKAISNEKFGDVVAKEFARSALTAGTPTYDEYLRPYLEAAQKGNAAEGLRVLLQKAQSPEAKAVFQAAVDIYEREDRLQKILEDKE